MNKSANQVFDEFLTPIYRLSRDMITAMRQGGGGVTDNEARYFVDLYYEEQEQRIRLNNQVKGLERDAVKTGNKAEPHLALDWLLGQKTQMETNVKKMLEIYVEGHEMAWFFQQTTGGGPILSAGLLAHIDIKKCDTAGDLWSFAGLNPNTQWCGRDEAKRIWDDTPGDDLTDRLVRVAKKINRTPENLIRMAQYKPDGTETKFTERDCVAAISRKPFNGQLKTLCWKLGESFVKVSNNPKSLYGRLYKERKQREWERNIRGELSDQATEALARKNYGKSTDAYKWYSGACSPELAAAMLENGETPTVNGCLAKTTGVPMLPPDHVQSRARRWPVKIFLGHLHQRWREELDLPCPAPWVLAHGGHTHFIAPPQEK